MRKVLVTGAEGALGSALLKRLTRDRENEKFEIAAAYWSKPGQEMEGVSWVQMDLSKPASIKAGLELMANQRGFEPDSVLHCAGGFRWSEIETLSDENLDFVINANLKSTFYLVRAVVPAMKRRGFGRMVFVSSAGTTRPCPSGMAPYLASKAALNILAQALTEELKNFDINACCVLPTVIDTPANRKDMPDADPNRWVRPEALADLMVSLILPAGNAARGALIQVPGAV
ncbi:MAG: SDR family NAD(P)-dependent oxidoreductase [Bdellovibrionota bacterium]